MKNLKLYLYLILSLLSTPMITTAQAGSSSVQDGEWILTEGWIDGFVQLSLSCADSMNAMVTARARNASEQIHKTEDGGMTWKAVYSDSLIIGKKLPLRVKSVSYPTPNFAIAQYDSGYVVRTTDGGKNWSRYKFAELNAGFSQTGWHGMVSMFDEQYGYLSTSNTAPDRLFGTEDGGLTWFELNNRFPDGFLFGLIRNVKCMGKGKLICALYSPQLDRGGIATTSDGGKSWKIESEGLFEKYAGPRDFEFLDSLNGFAIAVGADTLLDLTYPLLYRTRDGGFSWEEVKREVKILFEHGGLPIISFTDTLNGIMGAARDILRTTDGGKTWESELDSGKNYYNDFWRVSRIKGNKGMAVSLSGFIMYYKLKTKSVESAAVGVAGEILLSPNPAKSIVNMRLTEELSNNADLGLYDNIGKKVLSKIIPKGTDNFQIDVSSLPNGIYNAVIRNGEKTTTQKVVVAK